MRTVLTVCATVAAAALILSLAYLARVTLTLCVAAGIFALSLHRAVDFLQRHRVKRGLALTLVLLGFFSVLVGFGLIVIPAAVSQARALVDQAPKTLKEVQASHAYHELDQRFGLTRQLASAGPRATELAGGALTPALKAVGGVITGVAGFMTFVFVMIFLLIYARDFIHRLLAESTAARRHRYERVLGRLYQSVGGYLSGLMSICGINATLTTTFLAVTGTPYFVPLGILSGVSSLVPYIGPTVAGVLISLTALATGGIWKGLATAIYFTAYGQLEGNVLGPLILKRAVHVSPLIVLLSVLLAGDIAGVPGAVLAVPIAASAQIVLQEYLRLRRKKLEVPLTGDVATAQRAADIHPH